MYWAQIIQPSSGLEQNKFTDVYMGKGNRYVSVLAYSAFEKTKLREGMFNKNHILPGKFSSPPFHLARESLGWDHRWDKLRKVTSAVQEHRRELGK